jgi:glutamyl-tRNA synthetase
VSYLLRLGWSHGDEETIPLNRAIELFSLDGLGKSASRFDFAKLDHINAHYIRSADSDGLFAILKEKMKDVDENSMHKIGAALPLLQERAATINDLATSASIFIKKQSPLTDKAQAVMVAADEQLVIAIKHEISIIEHWDGASLALHCKEIATTHGVKVATVMQILRASVVGTLEGPSIADIMAILGKAEVLQRMEL